MIDSDESENHSSLDMLSNNDVEPNNCYFKPLTLSTQHTTMSDKLSVYEIKSLTTNTMLMHIGHTLKTGKFYLE